MNNPLNYLRKRYLRRWDEWVHRRTRLCTHRSIGTSYNMETGEKTYYDQDTREKFSENPEPDHSHDKCYRKMTWWERRLCDAADVWIAGKHGDCCKSTWPLTPLWERRPGSGIGYCQVNHWWRFRNPEATHEIVGTVTIGKRKSRCIQGEYCDRHAPPEATPIKRSDETLAK